MKYDKIPLIICVALVTFSLIACSGGSGSSANTDSESLNDKVVSDSAAPDSDELSLTSSLDLVAPEGFDFNATQDVQLQLSIDSPKGDQAYVSVYTSYNPITKMADYDSRIVLMPLPDSNQLELNLNVPSYLDELWVEVWYADEPDYPLKASVSIDSGLLIADL